MMAGVALLIASAMQLLPRRARADDKVSKATAKYQDRPNGQQRCEICVNFQPPKSCRFVAGDISPKGWCQYFAARDNAH